jgi:hypothetical protein
MEASLGDEISTAGILSGVIFALPFAAKLGQSLQDSTLTRFMEILYLVVPERKFLHFL